MVRDAGAEGAASQQGGGAEGLLASLKESWSKTFIQEDRWKLFVGGVVTTLVITRLSILLGTLIGFAVFMGCRRGNRIANALTRFCIWLIEGMPVVVLLMMLYYVAFAEANLSGVTVSVIAFTLIFAAAVFNMLKAGVAAVGMGQMEAAYSLGYTSRKAFFKIILPQSAASCDAVLQGPDQGPHKGHRRRWLCGRAGPHENGRHRAQSYV